MLDQGRPIFFFFFFSFFSISTHSDATTRYIIDTKSSILRDYQLETMQRCSIYDPIAPPGISVGLHNVQKKHRFMRCPLNTSIKLSTAKPQRITDDFISRRSRNSRVKRSAVVVCLQKSFPRTMENRRPVYPVHHELIERVFPCEGNTRFLRRESLIPTSQYPFTLRSAYAIASAMQVSL